MQRFYLKVTPLKSFWTEKTDDFYKFIRQMANMIKYKVYCIYVKNYILLMSLLSDQAIIYIQ